MISLLNGQDTKLRLASISVTSSLLSSRFSARAQFAPPKPPPMTATRGAACASDGQGSAVASAALAMPKTAFLRVGRRVTGMSEFQLNGRRP